MALKVTERADLPGLWNIRKGNKLIVSLCQPIYAIQLGLRPTDAEVRQAARDEDSSIPADVVVRWS